MFGNDFIDLFDSFLQLRKPKEEEKMDCLIESTIWSFDLGLISAIPKIE